jgi:hypothetical protein
MSRDGEARILGGGLGGDASTARLPVLLDGLRSDRADFRAVAICSRVRLPDSDAVRVELEHQEGQTVHFVVPYNKRLEYGEPQRHAIQTSLDLTGRFAGDRLPVGYAGGA